MSPPPPLLRQLLPALLLLSLCGSIRSTIIVTTNYYRCPAECGTFAPGGNYASNLEYLLQDIYNSTPFLNYAGSYGAGTNKVFGTAHCDDYASCDSCISSVIDEIGYSCYGNLSGTVLIDTGCKIQYANCDTCYIPFDLPDNYAGPDNWPPPGYVDPPLPPNCRGSGSPPMTGSKRRSKTKLVYIIRPIVVVLFVVGAVILVLLLARRPPVQTGYPMNPQPFK